MEESLPEVRSQLVEYRTRRRSAGFMVMLGGGALGLFLVPAMWWLLLLFGPMFAALTWINLRELIRSGRRIVLDEVGFTDRTLGVGRIPWEEIVEVEVWSPMYPQFFLHLVSPDRWRKRQSWLSWLAFAPNRLLGYSSFLVNLAGTDAPRDELVEQIQLRIEETRLLGPVDRPLLASSKQAEDSGSGEEQGLPGEEDL